MKDEYGEFPDNDLTKVVELMAAGHTHDGYSDRHVSIQWTNGDACGQAVTQIVQLTGQAGNYAYYAPFAERSLPALREKDTIFTLGQYTHAERDRILVLANTAAFEPKSVVNSCRTWTRDILNAIVAESLLSQEKFDEMDTGVPLLKRKPEASLTIKPQWTCPRQATVKCISYIKSWVLTQFD